MPIEAKHSAQEDAKATDTAATGIGVAHSLTGELVVTIVTALQAH